MNHIILLLDVYSLRLSYETDVFGTIVNEMTTGMLVPQRLALKTLTKYLIVHNSEYIEIGQASIHHHAKLLYAKESAFKMPENLNHVQDPFTIQWRYRDKTSFLLFSKRFARIADFYQLQEAETHRTQCRCTH